MMAIRGFSGGDRAMLETLTLRRVRSIYTTAGNVLDQCVAT